MDCNNGYMKQDDGVMSLDLERIHGNCQSDTSHNSTAHYQRKLFVRYL